MLKDFYYYFQISRSGLFDRKFYMRAYPDVRQADVDPLMHFIRFGWREGRKPSQNFDTKYYLETNPDVKKAEIKPLFHYIKYGRTEGRTIQPQNFHSNPHNTILYRNDNVIRYLQMLVKNDGICNTFFKITEWFKTRIDHENQDLIQYILEKFPQKFNVQEHGSYGKRKWVKKIDLSAQIALQDSLNKLKIPLKSKKVLYALKTFLGRKKYYQLLEELFKLEQFTSALPTQSKVFPLIQTSTLPKITKKVRRRRILFITSQFPNPYHGGGNRVLNFIKILSQSNDIYLSTCFNPKEDISELKKVESYCYSIQTIHYLQFGGNQAEIRAWLGDTRMDIVHYEWPRSLENYDPDFGQVQIFTYMEATSLRLQMDLNRTRPLSLLWLKKFSELIYALRMELVDAAQLTTRIAVTRKDAAHFKELYPYQTYFVLNHGVTLDEFTLPDVESEPHTLVFVGNFTHYPNSDAMKYFFSEIWPIICKEVPDVRIYLVGPNPPEEITQLADGKQIIITGGVPDIRPYVQKATIGIAPLISGAGMRGKVIDYAALRRTFVATSIAMTDLEFKNGIDFFCANTAQDFAQKIITLLKKENLVRQMAASAFNIVLQNYDNHRLTDYLIRLYQHLEENRI